MKAEIIGVGTELLMGQIANTDAQYLSRKLSELGINVYYHHVVGDNRQRFSELFRTVLERADIIITTGGIGPTMDDLTKETIADALGLPMEYDEDSDQKIQHFFQSIHKSMTQNNLKQAYFPKGCEILPNDVGTAPGCVIQHEGKQIIILPGPPRELNHMFEHYVEPRLESLTGYVIESVYYKVFGMGESELESQLIHLIEHQTNPTLATYASAGEVTLRITARAESHKLAHEILQPVCASVKEIIGHCIYSDNGDNLAKTVVHLLIQHHKKIALAESCTGGMLASMLVDHPGSSAVLEEAVVTYSNEAKMLRLGVDPRTLDTFGAVSEQVAKEMALGLFNRSNCDAALSITGIAGPDDSEYKKAGLTYIAFYDGRQMQCIQLNGRRDRNYNRYIACLRSLDMIRKWALQTAPTKDLCE